MSRRQRLVISIVRTKSYGISIEMEAAYKPERDGPIRLAAWIVPTRSHRLMCRSLVAAPSRGRWQPGPVSLVLAKNRSLGL